jgi:membrane protein
VTALAAFIGSQGLASEAVRILFQTWPEQVAKPLASEVHNVLTQTRGGLLTLGVILSIYFSSSGVEALRIALNRAYDVKETRPWWLLRLESIAYVLIGAVALIALSFFVILGPLIFNRALRYAPWLAPFENMVTFARLGAASLVLIITLVLIHFWLPAGRRRLREIAPGIIATLLLWLAGGALFGRYLAEFADTYVTYYAGLASAMIALVFLYYSACIFLYGGELNAVLWRHREFGETMPEKRSP